MKVTRRRFLKGSVAVGAVTLGPKLVLRALAATDEDPPPVEDSVLTTCWIGSQACGIRAQRVDGRIVKLDGDLMNPLNRGALCPRGQAQIASVYDPDRLRTPLVRTNPKGERGAWREAGWQEAIGLVADRIREVRARDPRLVLWQSGRVRAPALYGDAFGGALGATVLDDEAHHDGAGRRAVEYTLGLSGVLNPDMENVRLILAWGWDVTNGGGNETCWMTWNQQLVRARERGARVVAIDPRVRGAGPFADRWLPLRAGTDLALALALCSELIRLGHIDEDYLRRHTNAPYLVGEDGRFRRSGGVPEVFDDAVGATVPAGTAAEPVLDRSWDFADGAFKTAYTRFKDHVYWYPPEWGEAVTGIPAADITALAREMGETAAIGSTTLVDGATVPLRPVGIMAGRTGQQELGFQAVRAMTLLSMLTGSIGAVGGQQSDAGGTARTMNLGDPGPPADVTLAGSLFYPIATPSPGIAAAVATDPERFGLDAGILPEVAILHEVDPVAGFPDRPAMLDAYRKVGFVAALGPWMTETADRYGDVVLPTSTIERYEGPLPAGNGTVDAVTVHVPPMRPLYGSRGPVDIYLDLSEATGTLTGTGGYLDRINTALELGEHALPTDRKPDAEEVFERFARSRGLEGLDHFRENGVLQLGALAPGRRYGQAADPPFGGVVHRLYGETMIDLHDQMQDVAEPHRQDFTAFPTWRIPTCWSSPPEYGITLVVVEAIEHAPGRPVPNPLLAELASAPRLDINPDTARWLGIADGDEVAVESHHALTGEIRRITVNAALTAGVRPDVVVMTRTFGATPGASPDELLFVGPGYSAQTGDQSFHVRVRVSPLGEEGR